MNPTLTLLTALLLASLAALAAPERPNVLLISTDQQNAGMLSCAGNRWLKPRAMDNIAQTGARFTRDYCVNPVCVPSRTGMFTGHTPARLGIEANGDKAKVRIPSEIRLQSMGALFRKAGYETAYGGKVQVVGGVGKLERGSESQCRPCAQTPGQCFRRGVLRQPLPSPPRQLRTASERSRRFGPAFGQMERRTMAAAPLDLLPSNGTGGPRDRAGVAGVARSRTRGKYAHRLHQRPWRDRQFASGQKEVQALRGIVSMQKANAASSWWTGRKTPAK